ncbi:hypothetical protein HDU98_006245 [Podochytrium sp. JEL0797]|nr:hypothetical protein HDU98_006245 [Podochytrium sp. JEL0797]
METELFVGRQQRVIAALDTQGLLTITSTTSPPKTLLSAPVTLLTLKVLAAPVSAGQKLRGLIKPKANAKAADTKGHTEDTPTHFRVISPSAQLPLYTKSHDEFSRFRRALDAARCLLLAQNGTPCCDSKDAAEGKALLDWLCKEDASNQRCGGCGRSEPAWFALEKHELLGLIVCDACSGWYRGLPEFIVRSFLFDVSVFEDRETDLYKAVASISNLATCIKLTHLESERLQKSSNLNNLDVESFALDHDATTAVSSASTTPPSHVVRTQSHKPLRLYYPATRPTTPCVTVENEGSVSDDGYDYTYMPPPPSSSNANIAPPTATLVHANTVSGATMGSYDPTAAHTSVASKLSPSNKLQQSFLRTQGKLIKMWEKSSEDLLGGVKWGNGSRESGGVGNENGVVRRASFGAGESGRGGKK